MKSLIEIIELCELLLNDWEEGNYEDVFDKFNELDTWTLGFFMGIMISMMYKRGWNIIMIENFIEHCYLTQKQI